MRRQFWWDPISIHITLKLTPGIKNIVRNSHCCPWSQFIHHFELVCLFDFHFFCPKLISVTFWFQDFYRLFEVSASASEIWFWKKTWFQKIRSRKKVSVLISESLPRKNLAFGKFGIGKNHGFEIFVLENKWGRMARKKRTWVWSFTGLVHKVLTQSC